MMDKRSDLAGADAYPGETSQAESDAGQMKSDMQMSPDPDYTVSDTPPRQYNWAMNGAFVSVHAEAGHDDLFHGMGHGDFSKPYAYGTLVLHNRWDAVWEIVYSNMGLHLVEQRLKTYSTQQGWQHAGIVDHTGMPFSGLGVKQGVKLSDVPGIGERNPGVKDWHNKGWSDMEQYDQINPVDYYGEQNYKDERNPEESRICSECGEYCIDYDDWRWHVLHDCKHAINPDRDPPQHPQPVVNLDDVLPADFNTLKMDTTVQRQARLIYKLSAGSEQTIAGPIPFIYDIEKDRIFVGHPGERHSDIQGRFTPGGIVEGLYQPNGQVQVRTDTDMPYTVRHMAELWYYMHPELVIKGIFLMVGEKKYRLATSNIGHKVRNVAATHPAVWRAYETLRHHGNVYAVGGAVRDVIRGVVPKDIDLMVQGIEPHNLEELMRQQPGEFLKTGDHFPVYRYKSEGDEVEIAMPRTERSTGPTDKDFQVVTNPYISVGEDMARRDFTANAMAVNLDTGDLVDPYLGAEDVKKGVLRSHNPRVFAEDPVRIMRALVSVADHGLTPSPELFQQLTEQAPALQNAAPDRIGDSLMRILSSDDPSSAMALAMATGVMNYFLPEVYATKDFDQKSQWHQFALDQHMLAVFRLTCQQTKDPLVRLAALLHDIGKPGSQWFDDQGYGHYYKNEHGQGEQHEELGADMTRQALQRLRLPNDSIDRVEHLVRQHMFAPFASMGGARRFLNRVGNDHADDLMNIRWADSGGKDSGNPQDGSVNLMRQYVQRVRESREPTELSQLAINGHDLIQAGIQPGPQMGTLLNWLLDQVLEDPSLNNRETLIQMALDGSVSPSEGTPPSGGSGRVSNILDPIKDELDPNVFERPEDPDPDVKEHVRHWVRTTVEQIMRKNGWPEPFNYLKIVLTGSLTTYQWGRDSDFDVSIWIDSKEMPEWVRADLISLMIEHAEGKIIPGTTHPLQAFVVDSRKYTPDDLYKPGLRSAYDLEKGKWLVLPEHSRTIDVYKVYPQIVGYAKMVEDKIRLLLKYDHPALKIYWKNLHMRRFKDERDGKGDYAESNIVYKWLANQGLFPLIAEATGTHIA